MKKRTKPRTYLHFDLPMSKEALEAFKPTSADIVRHSFHPLLAYTKRERRIDFDQDPWFLDFKDRDIRYASHMDCAVFSHCAAEIGAYYEAALTKRGVSDVVLAYRSGMGSNVDFALGLFTEIRNRGSALVICVDVSKFFDNIDHVKLKKCLCDVIEIDRLPRHLYKVFKRVTDYTFVKREDIEACVGHKPRHGRLCTPEEFRNKVAAIIQPSPGTGVAQGTSLSGLLANIYLLDFDAAAKSKLESLGGSYRRYSDDIAIVLPDCAHAPDVYNWIKSELLKLDLNLKDEKTQVSAFYTKGGTLRHGLNELQYLGFTFDGERILIRSSSIRRFYANMKRNVRRYVKAAAAKGIPRGEIHLRGLVRRFTHWGDDSNFIQYAYRASRKMKSPAIKRQLKRHVLIFQRYYTKCLDAAYP